jgi:bacterioferritin
MKRNDKLIKVLNSLLIEKLTAINEYMAHSEMCENLGFSELHIAVHKLATDQMLLAEWLIERISFLDGSATLSKLNSVMISKTVSALMGKNNQPESFRIHHDALKIAQEADDHVTTDLLYRMLELEEVHYDWAEIQRNHIEQRGLERYLFAKSENILN